MTPARREVWLFDLGMAEKVRPALVVSVLYGDLDSARLAVKLPGYGVVVKS